MDTKAAAVSTQANPPAPPGLSWERVEDMIRLTQRAFDDGEIWRLEPFVADHLIEHTDGMGRLDFRERFQMLRDSLAHATLRIEEAMIEGSYVATRWSVSGVHRRRMMGIAPTGRTVVIRGVSVERFEDGKVVERWEFVDNQAFLAQFEAA